MPEVVLYTREGCHLCEVALDVLRKYGLRPQMQDIDDDPELVKEFGECVPVVKIDGQIRFRGIVNEILLRRFLEARSD